MSERRVSEHGAPEHVAAESEFDPIGMVWVDDSDDPFGEAGIEHAPVMDTPVEDDASLADALLDGVPDAVVDELERNNAKADTQLTGIQAIDAQVTDTATPAQRVRADALCLCDIDAFEDVLNGKADTCMLKVVHDQSQGVATSGVASPRMVRSDPTLTTLECNAEMLRDFLVDDYPMTSAEDGTIGLSASIPVTFRGDTCEVADVATWAPGRDVGEKAIDRHRMFCDLAQQCELIAADERVAPDTYVATVRDVFTPELLERMASYHGVNIDAGLQESVRRFGDMVSREDDKVEQLPRREALRPGTVAYKVAAYRDAMTDGQDYAFKSGGMSF